MPQQQVMHCSTAPPTCGDCAWRLGACLWQPLWNRCRLPAEPVGHTLHLGLQLRRVHSILAALLAAAAATRWLRRYILCLLGLLGGREAGCVVLLAPGISNQGALVF